MNEYIKYMKSLRMEQLIIKNLVSNQKYQRGLCMMHVERTAQNFDVHQINPPKISFRDGLYYVINGQHTIEVIAKVTGSRDVPIWCMVFEGLTYEEEANIFANQQKYSWGLSPYDLFIANIESGQDKQIIISGDVERRGLFIAPKRALCTICAITSLEWIFDKYGYDILDRTLRLVVGAWEGDSSSLSSSMLKGIAHLISSCGNKIRDDAFSERLGLIKPLEILADARMRKQGYVGCAEVLMYAYNKGRKASLSMNLLRQ